MLHGDSSQLAMEITVPSTYISELFHSMQSCISDVKALATANMPRLNDNMEELVLVTKESHLHSIRTLITNGNSQIPFKHSVKNSGFAFDSHLSMNEHVSTIARTCYFELCLFVYY